MSAEANKAVLRRWWDALNQGKALEIVEEVYTADYVMHDPSQPGPVAGLEGVREFVKTIVTGFPDSRSTIEDLVAEGDKVTQRISVTGTHTGEFAGVPATGKSVNVWVVVISRFVDGKIAEEWQLVDSLGMLQQMGVIPAQG